MSRRSRGGDERDLDLVPIMNLVTILIPFLLMSTQFVALAIVDSSLPAIDHDGEADPTTEELGLRVLIGPSGFSVEADAELPDTVGALPCSAGGCGELDTWDLDGLNTALADVKAAFPDEDTLVLVPWSDVSYEVIIATMDAARTERGADDPLFPYVVVAGGASGP